MIGITRLNDCFVGNGAVDENEGFWAIFYFQNPTPELLKY
jgi:hypothetical protein